MIEPLLKSQLEPVARRLRRWHLWRKLALCWAAAGLFGLILLFLQRGTGARLSFALPLLGLAGAVAAVVVWRRNRSWSPDFRHIARQIEVNHPDLHALLLTAIEQQPDGKTGQFGYLQERVIRETIAASLKHRWIDTVSAGKFAWAHAAHWAALIFFGVVLLDLRVPATGSAKFSLIETAKGVTVTPGDTSIEKGSGLVVLARFGKPLPAEATLVVGPTPDNSKRITLVKNLDDPVFGGSLTEVTTDLFYHVEYNGKRTREFKVTVFEHPRLERADATVNYPEYTSLPEKKIPDTRRVSAVEGSNLELALQLNKPVKSAKLIAKDKTVVPLETDSVRANASLKKFPLEASKSYELQLVDTEGRTNKVPAQFIIDVLKNRPPELKLASPRGDQRVSPLEEINFQAEAWDDFGLKAYGLTYTQAGSEPTTIVLGESTAANEKRQFNYLLALEDLHAQPDQLVSYFVWADDVGPDGQVRRNASDMFFAEVRPFEEIFREGQPQDSQGGEQQQGGGGETMKLAELQKQIINATWKLQRQETGKKPSDQYKKDAGVVKDSQKQALSQAQSLKARTQNPQFTLMWEAVEKEMERAVDHLGEAATSPAPLPLALKDEQAAYQALLKLSAREYQVSRSKGQGGGGGGRNQQQLDQLELKQTENKYETQRQAQSQQNPEQREQLQVLNRLKELAQRQQDLNEKLKELQSALQEAKTDAEREDIRRRLKRLREEEQEMLADVDELRQRMEKPENQSRMAEAKQQLDKTRSEVQRAAEALENNNASQALTSGTRAQRELQQLRDDFRKKNSSQFADEMRQMRQEARELAQKQEEIGQKLDAVNESKRKSLSDSDEVKQLAEQLQKQKAGFTNLVDDIRNVSAKSETAEPLLSKQLYDTLRKSSQVNTENSLTTSSELLKRNFASEAGQFEQKARQEINELKQGVEHAAESVLGDDIESLRLAKRELDDLSQQLEREIARNDPTAQQQSGGQERKGQPGDGQADENSPDGQSGSRSAQNQQKQGQGAGEQQDQQTASAGRGQSKEPSKQASEQDNKEGGAAQQQGDQQGQQLAQQSRSQRGNQRGDSQQPGQSQQPGDSQQQGQSQSEQAGQGQGQGQQGQGSQAQNSQAQGRSPSDRQNNQSAQQQQGQRNGQQQGGQPPGGQQPGQGNQNQPTQAADAQGGAQQGAARSVRPTTASGQNPNAERGLPLQRGPRNFFDQGNPEGGGTGPQGPITGENYANWSDRLRDVEEMVDVPELRSEVARIRDRARAMRTEYKRHSKEPQWNMVKSMVAAPLAEVRNRVAEELARRESKDALVPIDRDPVPNKFSDLVKRYYEKLGSTE